MGTFQISFPVEEQKRESTAMQEIESNPGIGKTDLVKRLEARFSRNTANRVLKSLADSGRIIVRKSGRKMRHFPADAEEGSLKESLAKEIDEYAGELCAIKGDLPEYPHWVLIEINRLIVHQKDRLAFSKADLLSNFEYEYSVKDYMQRYDDKHGEIVKLLGKRFKRADIRSKVSVCLGGMLSCAHASIRRRINLENERKKLGGENKKRDYLAEEIKNLRETEDKLYSGMVKICGKLRSPPETTVEELQWDTGPLTKYLDRLEQFGAEFQKSIRWDLDRTKEQPEDRQRDGLKKVFGTLEEIEAKRVEVEKLRDRLYREIVTDAVERELREQVKKTEEYMDGIRKR